MSNNQHYDPGHVTSGVEPPTPLEMLPPHAQAIIAHEEVDAAREYGEFEANRAGRDALQFELAGVAIRKVKLEEHPRPNKAMLEHEEANRAKIEGRIRALEEARETRRRFQSGSRYSQIRSEFLETAAATKLYVSAETTDELIDGKSPRGMIVHYIGIKKTSLAEMRDLAKLPHSADEIRHNSLSAFEQYVSENPLTSALSAVRRPVFNERRGRFESRHAELPTVAIANGVGGVDRILDAGAVLFALFPEVVERFAALALRGHDETKAIDSEQRTARLKQIKAIIHDCEYKAEFWHRHCAQHGTASAPRIGGSILAVLDIREA